MPLVIPPVTPPLWLLSQVTPSPVHAHRVVRLAAAHLRQRHAVAERNRLYRRHGKRQLAHHAFHRAEERRTDARARRPPRIPITPPTLSQARARLSHRPAHRRFPFRVQQRKTAPRQPAKRPRVHALGQNRVLLPRDGGECAPISIPFSGQQPRYAAREHQRRSQPAGKMPAAARVVHAAVFDIARVIRVAGACALPCLRSRRSACSCFDHRAERRARRPPVHRAGEDAHRVRLFSRVAVGRRPARAAPSARRYNLVQPRACGQAVHHHADGRAWDSPKIVSLKCSPKFALIASALPNAQIPARTPGGFRRRLRVRDRPFAVEQRARYRHRHHNSVVVTALDFGCVQRLSAANRQPVRQLGRIWRPPPSALPPSR